MQNETVDFFETVYDVCAAHSTSGPGVASIRYFRRHAADIRAFDADRDQELGLVIPDELNVLQSRRQVYYHTRADDIF